MNNPNFKDVILWTIRRNERDVVNLYNYLTRMMQVSTGGNFLNFGYWDDTVATPLEAQQNLCIIVKDMMNVSSGDSILDVGSGLSAPAIYWKKKNPEFEITCINSNHDQLVIAREKIHEENIQGIHLVNSTALNMPIASESFDCIVALESAQHFRPIERFISEAKRIVKKNGQIILAIPVVLSQSRIDLIRMGILGFTWSSEHYGIDMLKKIITNAGLQITDLHMIGSKVYSPLARYYLGNRESLKDGIRATYPSYVESILYRSITKMKEMSEKNVIEYALVRCTR